MYPCRRIHYLHDLNGNIIAEADDNGTILREYIWIAHRSGETAQSGAAMPLAFVDNPKTSSKFTYVFLRLTSLRLSGEAAPDHLDRPVIGTNDAGSLRWQVNFKPFGEVLSVTGPDAPTGSAANDNTPLDARFPGQMYQLESGLAYNWHRHYDASIGRYIQPDPLGLIDGPSRYAYALSSPQMLVDPRGEQSEEYFKGFGPLPFDYHPRLSIPQTPWKKDPRHRFPTSYDTEVCIAGYLCKIGIGSQLPVTSMYKQYCLPGHLNEEAGVYEIGFETPLNPFLNMTPMVTHRLFRPNKNR